MASRQHTQQGSGFRSGSQAQLWERASRQEKQREAAASAQTKGRALCGREKKDCSKVNELSGNVYENKGPAFSSLTSSGNVVENKDSYA
jgi:hypothetical protein